MPEFTADPQVLSGAAHAVAADGQLVGQAAGALASSLHGVEAALPGSRTAAEADRLAGSLPAAVRALATELATLAGALAAAARDYAETDRTAGDDFRRAGRWPA